MKLIKPSFEIIPQEGGLSGVFKQIEIAARNCYKSEDKIGEGTAEKMVKFLNERTHYAMLEHGTVYLKIRYLSEENEWDANFGWCPVENTIECDIIHNYLQNKYSKVIYINKFCYITTNYRVLVENGWLDDLQYQCEPTEYHEKRVSVRFICDRGVSHEYVRNRGKDGNAFAQESTRYCNYIASKFGGTVSYCIPEWLKEEEKEEFIEDLNINEKQYFKWLDKGWKPQQARGFLNHFLKTELILTGTISDWKHFFSLRDDVAAHPSARELAHPLHEQFKELNLL